MKYTVALSGHAGTVVEVEAATTLEARTKAEEEAYVSLCHQCEHQVSVGDEWRAIEVLDDQGQTAWNDTDYGPDNLT
jgi:IS1 family transposase